MALTQAQWYDKIKACLPLWYIADEHYQKAHLNGLAAVLEAMQIEVEEHHDATMISLAETKWLTVHSTERSVNRILFENDEGLKERTRKFLNISHPAAIKDLVDRVLIAGESRIVEDFDQGIFLDRDTFVDRGFVFIAAILNTFTIFVPEQLHDPYSFADREFFCDREDFVGQDQTSQAVFDAIVEVVNKAKSNGTLYRIIEELEA